METINEQKNIMGDQKTAIACHEDQIKVLQKQQRTLRRDAEKDISRMRAEMQQTKDSCEMRLEDSQANLVKF